jgi:hypothetical protein
MTKYYMVIAIPEPVPIAGCMVGEPVQVATARDCETEWIAKHY